jgi:two-component system phosphate regulon sensor histidine kinase PhoR
MYRTLREQRQLAIHKNEFISNMTHELKTPLATVNVAVEALRNFNALDNPERTREYLDISALELQRLSLLVDKVLKLSQLEKKEVELHPEPLDLFALAVEVIDGLRLQLDKAGVQTLLTHGGGDFTVKADRVHMSGVLMNLLDNAVKYGGPAPRIEVHLARRGSAVILSVTDNGRGIPPEYAGKVFEQFFRVPSGDRHDTKGYGLGLSYVRDILHRHGGSVRVDSQVGRGSTFTLQLPAA